MDSNANLDALNGLITQLDFTLREKKAKTVLVVSDYRKEGKTTFLQTILPRMGSLYSKKILVLDWDDTEKEQWSKSLNGVDYVYAAKDLYQEIKSTNASYDHIFINTQNNVELPPVIVDGAILVRSQKSLGKNDLPVTQNLIDKKIPVLGIIFNEGII